MVKATDKDRKKKSNNPPEQKLGDTPVPPWEMPTPEEKEEAKPVRRALEEAVEQVHSQEEADEVIEDLEEEIGEKTATEVEETEPSVETPAEAARKVQTAAKKSRKIEETEEVLEETARVLAASGKRPKEVVSEAVQEVLNPEQQGAEPTVKDARRREYLRQAVLKRLKPLDALDANLFLAINHLPHTHLLNVFFYGITLAWQGAAVWYAEMGLKAIQKRRLTGKIFRYMALPLTITGLLVELPIKSFFRRRRPFITIIQAIVIGKKPGTWSFPSGHAAGAFAGAWLLNQRYPRGSLLRYIFASLVGFSRIYLGDHYPGDVASGSLIGLLFAMFFRRQARRLLK
jgi:membrane-associated phospholipid phosphatase